MAQTKVKSELIDGGLGTDWQSAIKTSNFTAEAGKGYFVNTTSGAITVSLPAGVAGNEVYFTDYAGTFDSNAIIFDANGSQKILGDTDNHKCITENATVRLIYQDDTKGWTADNIVTTITAFAVHHLVVGGGGGTHLGNYSGGYGYSSPTRFYTGGGGGGGFRTSISADGNGGGQPADSQLTVLPGTNYTVTVGDGGGVGATIANTSGNNTAMTFANNNGGNSVFSTIIALGGGYGGSYSQTSGGTERSGGDGGCGGGGTSGSANANAGNAVSTINSVNAGSIHGTNGTSPATTTDTGGGSGGGAGGAGSAHNGLTGGVGGLPKASTITGSTVYYAAGGSGSRGWQGSDGAAPANRTNGANSGDGGMGGCEGGGGSSTCNVTNAGGKKGIVIVRYPSDKTVTVGSGLTTGVLNGTVSGSSTDKYTTFTNGTGTITFS